MVVSVGSVVGVCGVDVGACSGVDGGVFGSVVDVGDCGGGDVIVCCGVDCGLCW